MHTELTHLLRLKETDLRLDTIGQAATAIDKGIHIGGAYSALIPLTALFYGGFFSPNIEDPTDPMADLFILSKGHAVAAMASIYADLGYFDKSWLAGSRSFHSLLNGHPGPILPGVPVSTGPLGHGISCACGFANLRRQQGVGDVFCMTGDGELQEGSNWEGLLYAAHLRLDNLCVMVDRNHGQSDCLNQLVVDLPHLREKFESFGWAVLEVDGTSMESVCGALATFRTGTRNGKPTAIICHTKKGFGGYIGEAEKHKATLSDAALQTETELLSLQRAQREQVLLTLPYVNYAADAQRLGYHLIWDKNYCVRAITRKAPTVKTRQAAPRNKAINYDAASLPKIESDKNYGADQVIAKTMACFARDPRVYSVDSDLANTSGLWTGVAQVDKTRALNVGIAEAAMSCVAEAYAAEGCHVWNSTFAVFFDLRALRRIAVSYQERQEAIARGDWLSPGHNLDITFLATAPNLETQTNGATHMGNDDALLVADIPNMTVIDVCCPRQLVAVMRWIAQGNRGLVYLRVPRMPFQALYPANYAYTHQKLSWIQGSQQDPVVILTQARGVQEALAAAQLLAAKGISAAVVDMPSVDVQGLCDLAQNAQLLVIYEQNNGYLLRAFQRETLAARVSVNPQRVLALNCLNASGHTRFIHSGIYPELLEGLGLSAAQLAAQVEAQLVEA